MSTTTLDVTGTRKVSLATLVRVELRKMYDTRAGLWLLISIAAITALVLAIVWFTAEPEDRTWFNLMSVLASPQGLLLPVLGILLVTQEWGQRTAMVTFALEPNRLKVIGAKVIAAVLFGTAAVVLAMVLAALATAIGGSDNGWEGFGADDPFKMVLMQLLGVVMGVGFGLVFLNSAAAIVAFFLVPMVFSIVANVWEPMRDLAPWLDLGTAQQPLLSGAHMNTEMWGHVATSSLIWVVLPLAVGLWRVLRAEIK